MGIQDIIFFDEDTLESIEKYTELALHVYKFGIATKTETLELKATACIALEGILRDNPDIFRYTKDKQAIRKNVTILLDGKEKRAYLE
jgi:hypothetical protein